MDASDALPDDLARESKFLLLTRLGFVARGLLYILIAALVLTTGRTEDVTGAMEVVGAADIIRPPYALHPLASVE